jgi:hypothetical protein
VLSIDARIQNIAFRELKNAVSQHQAKAGGVVVLDALTGEILRWRICPPTTRTIALIWIPSACVIAR